MNRQPNVMVSILLSLLVHFSIAFAVLWDSQEEVVKLAEVAQGITISLDQNTYEKLLQKAQQKKQQAMVKKEVVKPVKPKKIKVKKPKKVKEIQQRIININPKPEAVTYKVQAKTVEQVEPVKEPKSENIKVASATNTPIQTALLAQSNAQQTNAEDAKGSASQQSIDVNDSATKRYLAKLMRHLRRYKQYPVSLKKNHVEGKPVVRFSINKSGHVTNVEVKRRSSSAELDQAAMDVFRRASPLPKIPSEMARETLTMSLPIEYSLIND